MGKLRDFANEWRKMITTPDPLVQCISLCVITVLLSYKAMLILIPISKGQLITSSLSYPLLPSPSSQSLESTVARKEQLTPKQITAFPSPDWCWVIQESILWLFSLCKIVISFQFPFSWSMMDWPKPSKWSVVGKVNSKLSGHLKSLWQTHK